MLQCAAHSSPDEIIVPARQGGDDGVPASALGGLWFRDIWTALAEMRRGLSQSPDESDNIRLGSAWRISGGFAFSVNLSLQAHKGGNRSDDCDLRLIAGITRLGRVDIAR